MTKQSLEYAKKWRVRSQTHKKAKKERERKKIRNFQYKVTATLLHLRLVELQYFD